MSRPKFRVGSSLVRVEIFAAGTGSTLDVDFLTWAEQRGIYYEHVSRSGAGVLIAYYPVKWAPVITAYLECHADESGG